MKTDDQRFIKKDAVFDNVKILNGNQIPLTNSLDGKLPLRGSLIGLKSGGIHDFYYGNGLDWVQITNGDVTIRPPLFEVLAVGNVTGGNDIIITDGDLITSQPDGAIRLSSSGSASLINIHSQGQLLLESDRSDLSAIVIRCNNDDGGVDIDAGSTGVDIDSALGQIVLTSTQEAADAVQINASNGGIDINAGDDGINIGTGPINMVSTSFGGGDAVSITATNSTVDNSINISTNGGIILSNTKTLIGTVDTAHISTNQISSPTVPPVSETFIDIDPNSTDTAGSITRWSQSAGPGFDCEVIFEQAKTTYSVIITPTNAVTIDNEIYVSAKTPNSFTVSARNPLTSILAFNYVVIGYE